jgi:hypothetical protein
MGEKHRTHTEMISLIGKPEGKKLLASMWRKLEDDINLDHRETVTNVTPYVNFSLHYKL